MTSTSTHAALSESVRAFCDAWEGAEVPMLREQLTEDARLESNLFGTVQGAEPIAEALARDLAVRGQVQITPSNVVVRADAERAVVSAYLWGEATERSGSPSHQTMLWGGMLLLELSLVAPQPRLHTLRLQVNWGKGDVAFMAHWRLPEERLWQPGDPIATIVSDLDAPWRRLPASTLPFSEEAAIAEAWYQYAWGLDLADTAMYAGCFTDDVVAHLPPMGTLRGRREATATLKAFRQPWPWIQHYGEPIEIRIAERGTRASMLLGRLSPGYTRDADGQRLYSGYYRIELRKDAAHRWQIRRLDYQAEWATATTVKWESNIRDA
ncbi:nuclear transport factor 2 family protein [Halomonas coralii]|uniref:nuclear transport factor 2 family protein n=1 Tax=Modicisalibacter sp. R2A 31.J TaxID=2831898 RepID=UPI001CCD9AA4|nr:nuclear transport factor 2 family protein [Modicisalibacter sp. R2A 31.J]MBZ9557325.1 nuclear transport factor 2 family protein [Modicisalibacter sp. R2A 31.J]